MLIRRVIGVSMLPALMPGKLVFARTKFFRLKVGDIIIFQHNGLEKIKRIKTIDSESITVEGDNKVSSTDSRHFGSVSRNNVIGKVIKHGLQKHARCHYELVSGSSFSTEEPETSS